MLGFWLISHPCPSGPLRLLSENAGDPVRENPPARVRRRWAGPVRGPGHWRSQRRPLGVPPPPLGRT